MYDAITVCALFNFYNRWTDAMGVSDLPASVYAQSGGQLAAFGHLPPTAAPDEQGTDGSGASES